MDVDPFLKDRGSIFWILLLLLGIISLALFFYGAKKLYSAPPAASVSITEPTVAVCQKAELTVSNLTPQI